MTACKSIALFALVVAVAWGTAQTCPNGPEGVDYYDFGRLLSLNCPAINDCATNLCSCLGGTLTDGDCNTSTTVANCATAPACIQRSFDCLSNSSQSAMAASGTACQTWGANLSTALMQAITSATPFVNSTVYQSCASDACNTLNHTIGTTCDITNWAPICSNTSDTVQTLPPGVTAVPITPTTTTTILSYTLTFPGDYSAITKQTLSQQAPVRASFATAIGNKIHQSVQVGLLTDGSLIVPFSATIAASDTATLALVQGNVASINSGADTTWYASASASVTAAGGPALTAPLVSPPTTTSGTGTAAPQPSAAAPATFIGAVVATVVVLATLMF